MCLQSVARNQSCVKRTGEYGKDRARCPQSLLSKLVLESYFALLMDCPFPRR